jgi:DNA-binding Lrp family transcriptional regulator
MTTSFILIAMDEDSKETVIDAIRRHPAVSGVYTVADGGDDESVIYDIIVKVEAETRDELDEAESQIRTRKEVRSTLTLEVIERDGSGTAMGNKNERVQI